MTEEELAEIRFEVEAATAYPQQDCWVTAESAGALLAYVDFLRALLHDLQSESTAYQRGLELGMAAERASCVRFLEQEAACCQADQDPKGALLCRALAERLPMTAAQQVAFWDRALGEAAKWLAGEQENRTS